MEILLHKVCGRPASRTMTLRAAGPEDAAAFYALQNEVRAAMPHPEQFVPDTLENIARYLKEDLCIGGWDGGRLGAYFILRYCGQDAHNYAAFMGIPREEWDGWANADSAIVHPDYRGNGLQRKLLEAALARLRPGIVGIGATVSPENQYSLNNALASGCEIVCRPVRVGPSRFVRVLAALDDHVRVVFHSDVIFVFRLADTDIGVALFRNGHRNITVFDIIILCQCRRGCRRKRHTQGQRDCRRTLHIFP